MASDLKSKVRININVSREDKEQATKLFHDMGINLNTAINMFIKQSINEQGLPFQPKLESALDKAIKESKAGDTTTFESQKEFSNWLQGLGDDE